MDGPDARHEKVTGGRDMFRLFPVLAPVASQSPLPEIANRCSVSPECVRREGQPLFAPHV
jgi:hypothetical protein